MLISVTPCRFIQAAADNDVQTLRILAVAGIDCNCADYDSRTALHLSVSNGCMDATHFLLKTEGINVCLIFTFRRVSCTVVPQDSTVLWVCAPMMQHICSFILKIDVSHTSEIPADSLGALLGATGPHQNIRHERSA